MYVMIVRKREQKTAVSTKQNTCTGSAAIVFPSILLHQANVVSKEAGGEGYPCDGRAFHIFSDDRATDPEDAHNMQAVRVRFERLHAPL